MTRPAERLFEGADWDFQVLQRIHDACEEIALSELALSLYPNQMEVITAEQMLDALKRITQGRGSGMFLFTHEAALATSNPLDVKWISGKRERVRLTD